MTRKTTASSSTKAPSPKMPKPSATKRKPSNKAKNAVQETETFTNAEAPSPELSPPESDDLSADEDESDIGTDDDEGIEGSGITTGPGITDAKANIGDDTYFYEIKIPHERIAVLIGHKGEVKRKIESALDAKITIDSSEGDVTISGPDAINLMTGREIVRAVARGFNPEIALLLLKTDHSLEVISLADIARTPNDLARIKGRLIGAGGKARRVIEDLTESHISVYGKTISILAEADSLILTRRAIDMILEGSAHRNVYQWLERQRKSLRARQGFLGSDQVDD